jgi:hypothetical protein
MLWHAFLFLGLCFFPSFLFLIGGLYCFFLHVRFLIQFYSLSTLVGGCAAIIHAASFSYMNSGSYLRDALQEGNANGVACLHVLRA